MRDLPKRASRGRRMRQLVGEELDADELFWGQKAWAEQNKSDDEDVEYSSEEDVVDDDFDIDEGEAKQAATAREERTLMREGATKRKGRGVYVDPALKRKHARVGGGAAGARATRGKAAAKVVPPSSMSMRRSTKTKVGAMQAARKIREREQKKASAARRAKQKPKVEEKPMTQEELLAAAVETELVNKRSLELMLRIEEERKRAMRWKKKVNAGPVLRYRSRAGEATNTLTFTMVARIPSVINARSVPYPPQRVCAVTGAAARYRDPVTGECYATAAAFHALRTQHRAAQEKQERRRKEEAAITAEMPMDQATSGARGGGGTSNGCGTNSVNNNSGTGTYNNIMDDGTEETILNAFYGTRLR